MKDKSGPLRRRVRQYVSENPGQWAAQIAEGVGCDLIEAATLCQREVLAGRMIRISNETLRSPRGGYVYFPKGPDSRELLRQEAQKKAVWLRSIEHVEGSYATSGAADILEALLRELQ